MHGLVTLPPRSVFSAAFPPRLTVYVTLFTPSLHRSIQWLYHMARKATVGSLHAFDDLGRCNILRMNHCYSLGQRYRLLQGLGHDHRSAVDRQDGS